MRKFRIYLLFLLFFLACSKKSEAALFINEFNSYGESDWVEIYNSGPDGIDLSNYSLRDSSQTNKIDLTGSISSNGFAAFDWDNKLNNDGDSIKIVHKNDENNIVDQISYGSSSTAPLPSSGQTGGRQQDGTNTWVIFTTSTKNASNNQSAVFNTPTPTPTQSPTNAPTPTAKPSNTPTPTVKPTSPPTPTEKNSITPTVSLAVTPSEEPEEMMTTMMQNANNEPPKQEVKGESVDLGGSLSDLDKKESSYNWGKLLILMGAVLVTFACGIIVYNNYLKDKLEEMRSQAQ